MPDVRIQFSTHEGERAYGEHVAGLIRAERFDVAANVLAADLAMVDHELADCAAATLASDVYAIGWDNVAAYIFRPLRSGALATAVGVDISCHGDPPRSPEGWYEPAIEVSLYSDAPFAFSTKTPSELTAVAAARSVPWQGCGDDICGCEMETRGLARLHAGIESARYDTGHQRAGQPVRAQRAAVILAEWARTLCFHRAVKQALDGLGLARTLPVLVGSNEVAPFIDAVYWPKPSRETAAQAAARMEAAREAERAAFRADKIRRLEADLESVREMRKAIRAAGLWPSAPIRKLRGYYEAREALAGSMNDLGQPPRASWRITSDAAFEKFARGFYVDAFLK